MGKFIIFIAVVLVLCMIGLGVWWLGNKIYLSIRRDQEQFEIEKEGFEVAKKVIREDKEN